MPQQARIASVELLPATSTATSAALILAGEPVPVAAGDPRERWGVSPDARFEVEAGEPFTTAPAPK